MRRLTTILVITAVLLTVTPHIGFALSPRKIVVSPQGLLYVQPGETITVTVEYDSVPAVAGSTRVRVELSASPYTSLITASEVPAPDGMGQQVDVPVTIPPLSEDVWNTSVQVIVTNSEGEGWGSTGSWQIDAEAPEPVISHPMDGQPVSPGFGGLVSFQGQVSDVSPVTATLEISPQGANSWTEILMVFPTAFNSFLDVSSYPDGWYDLRVRATDSFGRLGTTQVSFYLGSSPSAPPDPPRNVTVTDSLTYATLQWEPPLSGEGVTDYRIYKDGTLAGSTIYTDFPFFSLTSGQTYSFEVSAVNSIGESARVPVSVTLRTVPLPPPTLTAVGELERVRLNWSFTPDWGPGVTGYHLYRDGLLLESFLVHQTIYFDMTPTPGVTHLYEVTTYGSAGESVPTTATAQALPPPATAPPGPFTVTAASANSQVTLTWTVPANMGGYEWDGYTIYRDGVWLDWVKHPGAAYLDPTVVPGTTYTYDVEASNWNDETISSVTVTASAGPPPPPRPSVHIATPTRDSIVSGVVPVKADSSYASSVQIAVDDQRLATPDWDTATVPDGLHRITALACGAGGCSTAEVQVIVDNTPPEIAIADAHLPRLSSPSHPATVTVSPVVTDVHPGTLALQLTDAAGQIMASTLSEDDRAPLSLTVPPALPDGEYQVRIAADDAAGNSTKKVLGTVTVRSRLEPPRWSPLSARTDSNTVSLSWGGLPDDVRYDLLRVGPDGETVVAAQIGTREYADEVPSPGIYTYWLVARDAVGNEAHSPTAQTAVVAGLPKAEGETAYVAVGRTFVAAGPPAFVEDGLTWVPLIPTAEALGATVEWNPAAQTVRLYSGGLTASWDTWHPAVVIVKGGKRNVLTFPQQSLVRDGELYVPVLLLAHVLGLKFSWDHTAHVVQYRPPVS